MKKLLLAIITFGTIFGAVAALMPAPVAYATHTTCSDGRPVPHSNPRQAEAFCSGTISDAEQQAANDAAAARAAPTCTASPVTAANCPFLQTYVVPAIRILSASVGIVVVIMVAWGGLQYTSSRDNPQQAAQAKDHIRNAILALVFYIFVVAFLNYIIPGGVF